MKIFSKNYQTIWVDETDGEVNIIDQTKLPHEFVIKRISDIDQMKNAIKTMEVRGAPLIGGAAAYGVALACKEFNSLTDIENKSKELVKTRPTAINLKWAVERMINKLSDAKKDNFIKNIKDYSNAINICRKTKSPIICEFEIETIGNIFRNKKKIHYHHGEMKLSYNKDYIVGNKKKDLIAFLPGSRDNEINKLFPYLENESVRPWHQSQPGSELGRGV